MDEQDREGGRLPGERRPLVRKSDTGGAGERAQPGLRFSDEQWARVGDVLAVAVKCFEIVRDTVETAGQVIVDFYRSLPPNWPIELDIEQAMGLASSGIPVVWVPPGEVLVELVAAPDREGQLAVLHTRRDELYLDVLRTLDEVTHQDLTGQVHLARRSVEAWNAGHHEAAQALAVAVAEKVVTNHFADKRPYAGVRKAAVLDFDGLDLFAATELRFLVAVAPVASFYTPWRPSDGTPPPEALSRHVTVHHPTPDHYNADNAIIAMLLQTSLLRAFQEVLLERDSKALAASEDAGVVTNEKV